MVSAVPSVMFSKQRVAVSFGVCLVAYLSVKWWLAPPASFITTPKEEYDYIIVGGGTAGCVLAARLSEFYSVLLVESGGEFGFLASMPLGAPFLQMSDNDWHFKSQSQVNSSIGLVDQVSFWPRGKGLGGTGRMNYLVHYPGSRKDFDRWEALGAEGWSYSTMMQYINKLQGKRYRREEFSLDARVCPVDDLFARSNMCLPEQATRLRLISNMSKKVFSDPPRIRVVKEQKETNLLLNALIESAKELRHLKLIVKHGEAIIHKGVRWDAYKSHLEPVLDKWETLNILLRHHATKVVIEGSKAVAVQVQHDDEVPKIVKARREIILSAGAVNSPALLLHSGIGPKNHLRKHGIDVVADLPVGMNLHDHLNVPVYVTLEQEISVTLSKVLRINQLLKYILAKKGLFSSSAVAGTLVTQNNIGIILFGMGSTEEKLMRVIANYRNDVFREVFPHHANYSQEGFVFLVSCLSPSSRGHVRLRSSNPKDPPSIDPRYLSDPKDVECTRRGIKLVKRLVMTEGFKQFGAKIHLPELPQCSEYHANINDNEYLECLIRCIGFTGYHPGGSVTMGNHPGAVLDSQLRVKNVANLRVVDASVLPSPVLGTPNSVIMSVADRAAEMILQTPQASTL